MRIVRGRVALALPIKLMMLISELTGLYVAQLCRRDDLPFPLRQTIRGSLHTRRRQYWSGTVWTTLRGMCRRQGMYIHSSIADIDHGDGLAAVLDTAINLGCAIRWP